MSPFNGRRQFEGQIETTLHRNLSGVRGGDLRGSMAGFLIDALHEPRSRPPGATVARLPGLASGSGAEMAIIVLVKESERIAVAHGAASPAVPAFMGPGPRHSLQPHLMLRQRPA